LGNKRSTIQLLLFIGGVISLGVLARPVSAQDDTEVSEMQREIEAQRKQLEIQQKQLDEQRQMILDLQEQEKKRVEGKDKKETVVVSEKQQAKKQIDAKKGGGISDLDKHERDTPTASNVTYYDPARSINIPGTKTDIGLHGLVEFQIIFDTVGLNNNRFDTATIPVDGGPSQTKFSINPTQVALSSTTKVRFGRLNTMISMDFNGELDSPMPRLRIAYGEFINYDLGFGILGGQAYATMLDLRAAPETLDFAMPAGLWQQRQPLLRVTKALPHKVIMEVSIETPENVRYIDAEKLTRLPDLAVAVTWQPGGSYLKHLRLSGLVRDLRAQDETIGWDGAVGWAVAFSAKLGLPFMGAKDNLKFNVHYGDGYGSQIKGGPSEGAFDAANLKLETTRIFATYGGLQHFWSAQFRSSLVYGYVNSDNPDFVSGDTFENTIYVAGNFIWSPVEKVNIGIEYLWGRRENVDGALGDCHRILLSSRVDF
jgi:hypothetical protein